MKRRGAGCDVCVCEVGSGKILAAELIRENIENSIRKKNESCAVFGIFKGDPSMAFHAVAKGNVQRTRRLLTGDFSRNPF